VIGLLANVYMQAGKRDKAGALLDQAMQKAERRQGNARLMGELQRLKGKLAGEPETPTGPFLDADAQFVTLLSQQKYDEALRVALSLRKGQDSPDPSLLNNIGLCYYKLAHYAEAEGAYLEAIKLRPNYDTAVDNLSLVYAKQGRFELAISFAERALQLKPGDPGFSRHLAAYRRQSGAGDPGVAK